MRRPSLGIVADLRSEYGSSPVLLHQLPIRQTLRSTVSNNISTFRIRAMFGRLDEPLLPNSKVGVDYIIRKLLKTRTVREGIGPHLYIRGIR